MNLYLDHEVPPATTTLADQSWILSTVSTFADFQILAFLQDADERERNSASAQFARVLPKDDGSFDLELGAALPDWFPNVESEQEYCMEVRSDDGAVHRACVSNQMGRVTYTHDNRQFHTIFPRCQTWLVYGAKSDLIPPDSPEVLTRTMVSMRFVVRGNAPLDALNRDVKACEDKFIECLNKIAATVLAIKKATFPTLLSPLYNESTFDAFYMVIRGKDPEVLANWRVVSSLRQAMRRPPLPFSAADGVRIREMLDGTAPVDDLTRLMHSGRCYAEGGLLEFALLQLIITAEIGTGRFVHSMTPPHKRCTDRPFAMMLSRDMPALCPATSRPDRPS